MSDTYFVTGALGCIGAWVVKHLVDRGDKPVVFTGAQRHAGDPDTDGPRNIAEAVRVAASPAARGIGAMIVFEQDIHAGRDVTKAHTSRVDTFRSSSYGKLGEVDGENVFIYRRPAQRSEDQAVGYHCPPEGH